ncbi:MAG TPA: glycosyltransferase family 4 protein [Stellaceae bacterium]|nr:glycosyltransferase family 4 protein [Stellaceae bacterium]
MMRRYFAPDAGGAGVVPKIRILTFTTLYPNAAQPNHGVFVENRLRHLVASGSIAARVLAPVPWFPSRHRAFGDYARYAEVPVAETRHELAIVHPRYLVVPKLGMSLTPLSLFAAALPAVRRLVREQDIDLIDAHYAYPDGVTAAMLGRVLGKPVVITARGTDVNLIPRHVVPRRMIRWAASGAAAMITVADALKAPLIEIGVPADRITTLRNGVDLTLFRPQHRTAARRSYGFEGKTLLSVGHLIERKGHHHVIAALRRLPALTLAIAGEGPERGALEALAQQLDVAARVRFLGALPHDALPSVYSAADALVLASSREGWPNVLLEAMACGTPVIASHAWGNPEIVADPAAGVLMCETSADGVAEAVYRLFAMPPARAATRAYAERFSWDATTDGQLRLFDTILAGAER